jgi:hypothetical protein
MANPQDDWKFWLVVNPAKWIVPIFITLLTVSVLIHLVAFNSVKYGFLNAPAKTAAP